MSKIVQLLITQCTRSVFSRLENHEKNSFVPLVGFLPRASPDLGPFLALIAYERYYATTRVALASGLILNEIGAEADIACYNRFSAQDVMVSSATIRSSVLYTLENTEGRCTIFTIVLILPHDAAAYEYDYLLC